MPVFGREHVQKIFFFLFSVYLVTQRRYARPNMEKNRGVALSVGVLSLSKERL